MNFSTIQILFEIIAFLFAISFHESAHAWSANRFGDPTARLLGRISLNPVRHIDPIGTILFPLIGAISGAPVFGWAKPTPVDTSRLRNPVRDHVYVAAAGPVSNFVVAAGAVILLLALRFASPEAAQALAGLTGQGPFILGSSAMFPLVLLLYYVMFINVILAVFNLIPIPPLDGGHILEGLLPAGARAAFAPVKQYGFFLLLALFWFGGAMHMIFSPFLSFFNSLLRI
ncbi:MAG: site-2 protease family protein [Acidobacteria bacterium]|nr:site-2 protease family protein [Acidobacteriota bacterium]